MTTSPLIQNGRLSLDASGNVVSALDILTQMPVTLTAFRCMYNKEIDSKFLEAIAMYGSLSNKRTTLSKIIINAYKILISNKIISSPKIFIKNITVDVLGITINVLDIQGNSATLSWNSGTNQIQVQ